MLVDPFLTGSLSLEVRLKTARATPDSPVSSKSRLSRSWATLPEKLNETLNPARGSKRAPPFLNSPGTSLSATGLPVAVSNEISPRRSV